MELSDVAEGRPVVRAGIAVHLLLQTAERAKRLDAPVTDADVFLGRIFAAKFAGGSLQLDKNAARNAIDRNIRELLGLDLDTAAFGVSEVVDENMTAAARAMRPSSVSIWDNAT